MIDPHRSVDIVFAFFAKHYRVWWWSNHPIGKQDEARRVWSEALKMSDCNLVRQALNDWADSHADSPPNSQWIADRSVAKVSDTGLQCLRRLRSSLSDDN